MRHVVLPIALVNGAIRFHLSASTISSPVVPLAMVEFSAWQLYGFSLLERKCSGKLKWPETSVELTHLFGTVFWQLLRLRLHLSVVDELDVNISAFIDTFAGLAISHSNYYRR
jgi:hypothetical protein